MSDALSQAKAAYQIALTKALAERGAVRRGIMLAPVTSVLIACGVGAVGGLVVGAWLGFHL